jgi:hypothetical protein
MNEPISTALADLPGFPWQQPNHPPSIAADAASAATPIVTSSNSNLSNGAVPLSLPANSHCPTATPSIGMPEPPACSNADFATLAASNAFWKNPAENVPPASACSSPPNASSAPSSTDAQAGPLASRSAGPSPPKISAGHPRIVFRRPRFRQTLEQGSSIGYYSF